MITADDTFNIKIKLFLRLNETRGLLMIHNDQVSYETCLGFLTRTVGSMFNGGAVGGQGGSRLVPYIPTYFRLLLYNDLGLTLLVGAEPTKINREQTWKERRATWKNLHGQRIGT